MSLKNQNTDELNSIVPGIVDAYEAIQMEDRPGFYTSAGNFYNHTFFGRDAANAGMVATTFDHEAAKQTILELAALQGTYVNPKTQEQPGRIHHELRDFRKWKGSFSERLVMRVISHFWGGDKHRLLTYYSCDTTASFIRLVHEYAKNIDEAILDHTYQAKDDTVRTVRQAVGAAAEWIMSARDEEGLVVSRRTNRWSLPYQTYQDSVTAYINTDGRSANYHRPLAFLEVQALCVDALRQASVLLIEDDRAPSWKHAGDALAAIALEKFWMPEQQFFSYALDQDASGKWRQFDTCNIAAAWVLNTSLFHTLSNHEREKYIAPVIRRLFSDEFLTEVGLRTRSIGQHQPLGGLVDYHGAYTVWPMFNYLAIEGLRYHHLNDLAEQLENRLINGINWDGYFSEYSIVLADGKVATITGHQDADEKYSVQMIPDRGMTFTIAQVLGIVHRLASYEPAQTPRPWQEALETEILSGLKKVPRYSTGESLEAHRPVSANVSLHRKSGLLASLSFLKGPGGKE